LRTARTIAVRVIVQRGSPRRSSGVLDTLVQWDQALFHLVNGVWTSALLDAVLPVWRDRWTWLPLYAVIAIFAGVKMRARAIRFLLFAALTVAAAETASSHLLKPAVGRPRPCHADSHVQSRVLVPCGPADSFPSSHSTNHMALGLFLFLALRPWLGRVRWLLLPWPLTIAYGQVYVGVHYPADVAAGLLLGAAIGAGSFARYRNGRTGGDAAGDAA
jgi:membrane-associated phospholipid phosphatase